MLRPFKIQKYNTETEAWDDCYKLHAISVNRTGGSTNYGAAADQFHMQLTFTIRWQGFCNEIEANPNSYRIVYKNKPYHITDYDDFMQKHLTVKIVGEAYE